MAYNAQRHDIGITDVGTGGTGTAVTGMMLVKDDKGIPIYQEFDDHYLAEQFFTGGATLVNTPPEKRLIHEQSDFRSGFGLQVADPTDPLRYHASYGMDLRHKGMAIAGWDSTAINLPDATNVPTIINGTFEADSSGWDYSDAKVTRSSVQAQGGSTYSLRNLGTGSETITSKQSIAGWTPGVQYTVSIYIYGLASGDKGRIGIDDGQSSVSYSSYNTGASWVLKTVQKTLVSNAKYFTIFLESVHTGASAVYFDTASVTMDDAAGASSYSGITRKGIDFNNKLYFTLDTFLMRLNDAGDEMLTVFQGEANITDIKPFQVSGADYLFIALGTSQAYWYLGATSPLIESTLTITDLQFLVWVNTTVDTLYANDGDNTIRSTVNPLNGGVQWSTTTIIGDAATPITHLQEKDGALLIDKQDFPYFLDDSGDVQKSLAPTALSGKSTHSGKNSTIWQGVYYRPTGDQALLSIGTTNEWIQPGSFSTRLADFAGQVEAVVGDEQYLYTGIDNDTKIEILTYREEVIDGVTRKVWHPIHELTLAGIETMFISTVFQKRLWIASTDSGNSLYYLPLPTTYGNITADSNRFFKTDVYFETYLHHGGFKSDNKAFTKITATMGHTADSDVYFEAHYKKLEDTSWTDIGDLIATSSNARPSLFLPTDSDGADPVSTMMQLKFVAKTDTDTTTPIMLDYRLDSILYPPVGTVIYAQVYEADEVTTNQSIRDAKSSTIKTTIDNARAATWPVTIKDLNGAELKVKFLPLLKGTPRRVPIKIEKHRKKEWAYNVLMQVETLS